MDTEEILDEVHDAMLKIQAEKQPGCKLQEVADAVDGIESRQQAHHRVTALIEDGRVIKRSGAGGYIALTDEEQAALVIQQVKGIPDA